MYRQILIAEDHALLCRSIRTICAAEGIHNLEEVQTCKALLQVLKQKEYTHLILDITLADGNSLPLLPKIRKLYPTLKVLVYSSQPSRLYGEKLLSDFNTQYISKAEQEVETIQKLLAFLKNIAFPQSMSDNPGRMAFDELTLRQMEVLQYLIKGWESVRIASKLRIKASTVRVMKGQILEKTKAKNVVELTKLANLHGL